MHFWLCTTWSWKSLNLSHIYLKSYILYYLNCRCKSMYIAQNEQLWDQTTFAFILKSKYNFEVHLFNFCKTFCTFTCRDPNEQNQDFLLKLTDNGTEIHTRKTNLQVLFSNVQYHQASSLMQLFHTLSKNDQLIVNLCIMMSLINSWVRFTHIVRVLQLCLQLKPARAISTAPVGGPTHSVGWAPV